MLESEGRCQAAILESEGQCQAAILESEGRCQAAILESEGRRQAAIRWHHRLASAHHQGQAPQGWSSHQL